MVKIGEHYEIDNDDAGIQQPKYQNIIIIILFLTETVSLKIKVRMSKYRLKVGIILGAATGILLMFAGIFW